MPRPLIRRTPISVTEIRPQPITPAGRPLPITPPRAAIFATNPVVASLIPWDPRPDPGLRVSPDIGRVEWERKAAQYGYDINSPETALVMSGGGAKGSFEVGALAYLARSPIWRKINLRYVCGSSVGSINALKIAEGGKGGVERLVNLYVSLKSEDDMFLPQDWLNDAKAILKEHFGIDLDTEILPKKVRKTIASDILFGMNEGTWGVLNFLSMGKQESARLFSI